MECQNPECKWQKRESTRQLPTPETLWPQAYAATVTLNFESKVHKYQNTQMLNCMKYKYIEYRYTNATPRETLAASLCRHSTPVIVTLNFESKVQCNCCQDIDTRLHKYTKVPKKLHKNTQLDKYRNETVEARHFGHLPLPAAGCHLKGTMHFGTVGVTYTNFRIKKHRNTDTTTKCQKKFWPKSLWEWTPETPSSAVGGLPWNPWWWTDHNHVCY